MANWTVGDNSGSETLTDNDSLYPAHINELRTQFETTAKARAYLSSSNQENLTDSTWTKVTLNAEDYDPGTNFDAATDYDFTVPTAGYYLISGQVMFVGTSLTADKPYACRINKNSGTGILAGFAHASNTANDVSASVVGIVNLAANDTVHLDAISYSGTGTVDIAAGSQYTFMDVHLISLE